MVGIHTKGLGVTGRQVASKMAYDILNLDYSILNVLMVDHYGRTLADLHREEYRKYRAPKGIEEMSGVRTSVALGMGDNWRQFYGSTEFVSVVYKKVKVMLIPMPSHDIAIRLTLRRSADVDYVNKTVRQLLGV